MKQIPNDYGVEKGTTNIFCDNASVITISKNPILHSHDKHIEIFHNFIKDLVENKVISLEFVPTEQQLANIFNKPLDSLRFEFFRKSLGRCLIDLCHRVRA